MAAHRDSVPVFESSHVLEGRTAILQEAWSESIVSLRKSKAIRERLIAEQPTDASLRYDLAFAWEMIGFCHYKLIEFDNALSHYTRAKAVCESNLDGADGTPLDALGVIRLLILSTNTHLARNAENDWHQAQTAMARANHLLIAFEASAHATTHRWEISTLRSDLRATEAYMTKYEDYFTKNTS